MRKFLEKFHTKESHIKNTDAGVNIRREKEEELQLSSDVVKFVLKHHSPCLEYVLGVNLIILFLMNKSIFFPPQMLFSEANADFLLTTWWQRRAVSLSTK